MVYSRRRKNYRRRGPMRRRSNFRRRNTSRHIVPRQFRSRVPGSNSFGPLGRTMAARFRIVQEVGIDPATGQAFSYVFGANSLYPWDVSAGGGTNTRQPYGWPSVASFYNKYTILGSRISCTSAAPDTDTAGPYYLSVTLTTDGTAYTGFNVQEVLTTPATRWRCVQQNTAGPAIGHVNQSFSARKFFGTGALINSYQCTGTTGAPAVSYSTGSAPPEVVYYQVAIASQDSSENIPSTPVVCCLDYYVVFSDPINNPLL